MILGGTRFLEIPKLPPIEFMHGAEDYLRPHQEDKGSSGSESSQTYRRPSLPPSLERPPAPDPYASTDYSTYILPIVVPLAALLPIVLWFYRS